MDKKILENNENKRFKEVEYGAFVSYVILEKLSDLMLFSDDVDKAIQKEYLKKSQEMFPSLDSDADTEYHLYTEVVRSDTK